MHFERLKYSYDKMGNISAIFKNGTLIVKYTYDTLNRIIREDIYGDNSNLTSATRYYYSEAKPTASGNYWHYKENGEIEEW